MRFYKEKEKPVSDYPPDYGQDFRHDNGYATGFPGSDGYDDGTEVRCPPHTTERKLVTRIDLHVVPFLCIMYRMPTNFSQIEV